jgi:hypothetical protein
MPGRVICALLGLAFSASSWGQQATAAFAPAQLRLAEAELRRAEEALSQRDFQRARELAALAGLDARIAYGMSDSAILRRDAAQLHEQSSRLRWLTLQERVSSLP